MSLTYSHGWHFLIVDLEIVDLMISTSLKHINIQRYDFP